MAASKEEWEARARRVEDIGYSTLLVPDHFGNQLGPVAALMAAAAATTRLRIGSLVFDNDFRHPALLAKEVATLDVLSGGRLDLGLGAGWLKAEYDQAGLAFESGSVRVARLEGAVKLLKALFSDGPLTDSGSGYRITDLEGYPKPLQKPHPPILIGGGGRQILSLAAREANIIGIGARSLPEGGLDLSSVSSAAMDEQLGWVRNAAGARLDELELHLLIQVVEPTNDRTAKAKDLAAPEGLSPDLLLDSPHFLIGTVDEICAALERTRERYGISYFSVHEAAVERFAPIVDRLAGR